MREVVFPIFIDSIVFDEFRMFFLAFDLSRVVFLSIYPSWDSSTILEGLLYFLHYLFLSGPETAERKMLVAKALTHLNSCVVFTFICIPFVGLI